MQSRPQNRALRVLALLAPVLICLGVVLAPGCNGTGSPPEQVNNAAAAEKKAALEPRLQAVAAAHAEVAPAVKDVLDKWESRDEAQTFQLVAPLAALYVSDHPDDAEAVKRLITSWQRRLAAVGSAY